MLRAASRLYPPRDPDGLRELHRQIVASPCPAHQKQSLIYYVLRDLTDQPDALARFVERSFLPDNYRLFVDGLWHLDRLHFHVSESGGWAFDRRGIQDALRCLTDPSLIPTFPDEILYTLCVLPKDNDGRLALAYYTCTSPPLADPKALRAYFAVLCRTSITAAFYFARRQQPDETVRRELLDALIVFVMSSATSTSAKGGAAGSGGSDDGSSGSGNSSVGSKSAGAVRVRRANELVSLPFDDEEARHFEECLLRGPARHYVGAKDTVLMRRVLTGKTAAGELARGVESLDGKRVDGLNWVDFRKALAPSSATELFL
ncbi:hypothetical protein KEM52_003604 [Ascosphaera acerosa]|nr:hypothetical protein KEM52_003604 [Ascosphaera acerosa]